MITAVHQGVTLSYLADLAEPERLNGTREQHLTD